MSPSTDKTRSPLLYACYTQKTKEEERFVQEHSLTRVLSGSMLIHTVNDSYTFSAGDTVLAKRNQLIKATKLPPEGSTFESVSVFFEQSALREYAAEQKIPAAGPYNGPPVLVLAQSPLYESYASSLAAYRQGATNNMLAGLKVKEALMLILHLNHEASDLLFDFREPGKIDLEEYMNTHFKFNVDISRFAYLTGRSLATFKRDFAKRFNTSPNKWLQQRRLKEAHYLLKEKGMRVSDVYLEVGFEDLSHFSYAFKNAFGKSPSLI
jgi:AraC-like DNA-binding protein